MQILMNVSKQRMAVVKYAQTRLEAIPALVILVIAYSMIIMDVLVCLCICLTVLLLNPCS